MKSPDELRREVEVLRNRISKLSEASLRISSSLDLNTVLREVVESARELTGARYGAITILDDSRQPQDFVTSGLTPDDHRRMLDWPDSLRFFEHLRDLPGPLRLRDLHGYVRSLGYSPDVLPPSTFQGTPMHHQGVQVGNFFLAGKEDGPEFTSEDEEVLLIFAAQAATAIANARTHRDEQRARADLEVLVDTSPVGVVVMEARTVNPVLFNREAMRIVEGLFTPGQSPEQLLEVVTCRFGDGREFSAREFPLAQALGNATRVRAEEIVLQVPDGRSITTLFNATPIRSEDGTVESVVITLQDLAPIEELVPRNT